MEAFLAHCSHAIINQGGLLISIVIAGIVGSVTHCAPMCGPMVAAQVAHNEEESVSTQRMLFLYHIGRLTTYVVLGILVAGSSYLIFGNIWFPLVSKMLLITAGILFIMSAISPRTTHKCCAHKSIIFLSIIPTSIQFYIRGILLGFIPCGLLLAALLLVATTQNSITGGFAMLIFGLTTIPVLQIIGLATCHASMRWRAVMSVIGRGAMTVNGLMLCTLGMNAL